MARATVNIREISRRVGLSTASVSRVLNDPETTHVSKDARARILAVCRELKYQPNEHTRRMFSRRADTVALFFSPVNKNPENLRHGDMDAVFHGCLLGVQAGLAAHDIDLLLVETSERFIQAQRYLKMIRGNAIDGVIAWGCLATDHYLQELQAEGAPLVLLQNAVKGVACGTVVADEADGMRQLALRLFDAGHRRVAVASPSDAFTGRERLKGILAAFKERGLEPVYRTREKGFGYTSGVTAAAEILAESPPFTAVMCPNDAAAWGCIEEFRRHGLDAPGEISITGADHLATPGEWRLSSFRSPSREMGLRGAELMLRRLAGDMAAPRVCLPVELVAGATIRAPARQRRERSAGG